MPVFRAHRGRSLRCRRSGRRRAVHQRRAGLRPDGRRGAGHGALRRDLRTRRAPQAARDARARGLGRHRQSRSRQERSSRARRRRTRASRSMRGRSSAAAAASRTCGRRPVPDGQRPAQRRSASRPGRTCSRKPRTGCCRATASCPSPRRSPPCGPSGYAGRWAIEAPSSRWKRSFSEGNRQAVRRGDAPLARRPVSTFRGKYSMIRKTTVRMRHLQGRTNRAARQRLRAVRRPRRWRRTRRPRSRK